MRIQCKSFKRFERNTLRGFCEIEIADIGLTVRDVAIHEKNSSRWAQLPSKPMISRDGVALKDDSGKIKYAFILDFGSRDQRDVFSKATVSAVLAYDRTAFEAAPF